MMDGYGYGPQFQMYGGNPYMQGIMGNRTPQSIHVDQVDGEQGARELPMPPNSEKLVLDKTGEMIWLIKTDTYGMKYLIDPYDIKPHKTQQATQFEAMDARLAKLEAILSEFTTDTTAPEPASGKSEPIYAT